MLTSGFVVVRRTRPVRTEDDESPALLADRLSTDGVIFIWPNV